MKIGQSYRFALAIFTVSLFLFFVASEVVAGNNSDDNSRNSDENGKSGKNGKGKKKDGDEIRRGKQGKLTSGAIDHYLDSLFGSLFMIQDPIKAPTILITLPVNEEGLLFAKSSGDGGGSTDTEPLKTPVKDDKPGEGKKVKRPGARIWNDDEYGGWQKWRYFNLAQEEGGTAVRDSTGLSEWGREALRRLRKHGPGHTPPQGWEPGSENVGNIQQTVMIPEILEPLPPLIPPKIDFPPVIFIVDYPELTCETENMPEIGLNNTLIIPSQKELPELEIGYIPFYSDAPATIGGPEDAKRTALLAGVLTLLIGAVELVPKFAAALANSVPIFIIMPDEDGMMIIHGRGGQPIPRV